MPSVSTDDILRKRLARHVARQGSNVSAASRELGLNPVFVWRFIQTGNAIERNRHALRVALDAVEGAREPVEMKNDTKNERNAKEKRRAAELTGMLRMLVQAMETYVDVMADVPGRGRPKGSHGASGTSRSGHDEQE